MELEESIILKTRFWEEEEDILSILRYVSSIVISVNTCCSSVFVVVVIFAEGVSLNLF